MNYSRFEAGDIVVLRLVFSDMSGSKLRPVLVLNKKDLENDLIVVKITSIPGRYRVVLLPTDLESGFLKKTSYIDCGFILTVEKQLVLKKIGRIHTKKLEEVRSTIREILGL